MGLGLTNTISEQEFKAILAHEFGHFSQRSMKVGSYVYNVNQVIFNMLFDNESFDNMIQKWANISGYFSIFVFIGVKIINGIQWILGKMYGFVNIHYMALSREMEFHADEVAANIAGYLPLKESLLRLDLASHSLNSVLNFYESKIPDNLKSKNIYTEQLFVMNFLAKDSNISFKNNLPLVSELDLSKYNKSKLNIKDQWASHPSTEERIAALEKLNIFKENNMTTPANLLFSYSDKIEERITTQLFKNVTYTGEIAHLEVEKFKNEYTEIFNKNSFAKIYNGYYDNKNPIPFSTENINISDEHHTLEALFSKEKLDLVYDYIALENDKSILTSISNKEFQVKTFDYEGRKYNSKDAKILVSKIENDFQTTKKVIAENDINIYTFFYRQAAKKGNENILKNKYHSYFKEDKEFDKRNELYNKLVKSTNFVSMVTSFEEIKTNLITVSKIEVELKIEIKKILENDSLKEEINKLTREHMEKYLSKNWSYFKNDEYDNENLQILFAAANDFNYLNARAYFLSKLHLLNYQIEQL
ncbi:MAG TPA: M48 family metalloprotease [Bacteroidia bacterium]|nr:M48 family metalloprotease [Bacteroidia bacterium]